MASSSSSFDPHLCASLHNQIIAILAPKAADHNNRVVHNFFVAYGDDANAIRGRLSQPLVTFLENIDIIVSDDAGSELMNFVPHLAIPHPNGFWVLNGGLPGINGEEHENWVVLYLATEQECGIYFDMDTNLCTWQQEVVPWVHTWYPLERALRLWLNLYESGKFQPSIGLEAIYGSENHERYIPSDLDRDLEAYDKLISAIQARSPVGTSTTISDEPSLVDEGTLNEFRISGILRDFLLKARRPNFQYIAPGLRLPSSEWLQEVLSRDRGSERYNFVRDEGRVLPDDGPWQPDWMQHESNYVGEPLPLFPGPEVLSFSEAFEREHKAYLVEGLSGLYGWPDAISEDAVRLVLPYPIGANGWVRDGNPDAVTDENRQDVPESLVNNDSLYQYGWCPFLPAHLPPLSVILNNWRELIEAGEWSVAPDGVEGGVDVFKDADTEEHGPRYRIGGCFDEA